MYSGGPAQEVSPVPPGCRYLEGRSRWGEGGGGGAVGGGGPEKKKQGDIECTFVLGASRGRGAKCAGGLQRSPIRQRRVLHIHCGSLNPPIVANKRGVTAAIQAESVL